MDFSSGVFYIINGMADSRPTAFTTREALFCRHLVDEIQQDMLGFLEVKIFLMLFLIFVFSTTFAEQDLIDHL